MAPFRPPPPPPPAFAPPSGEAHLRSLAIGYYVLGGLTMLTSLVFVVHIVIGAMVVSGNFGSSQAQPDPLPAEAFGWFFVVVGSLAVLFGASFGAALIAAGRFLSRKRNLTFCQIVAGLACMSMPLGTVLGVLTFIVLSKHEVKTLFR